MSASTHPERTRADVPLRWTFALAMLAFFLLSALDVASTYYAATHHAGQEVNHLIAVILAHSGILGFAAVKATGTGAEAGLFLLAYLLAPGRWRWLAVAALLAVDAWLFALDAHNLFLVILQPGLFL